MEQVTKSEDIYKKVMEKAIVCKSPKLFLTPQEYSAVLQCASPYNIKFINMVATINGSCKFCNKEVVVRW